jgi:predicted AlkP superfamily phosphohydrolase/phosphomutase
MQAKDIRLGCCTRCGQGTERRSPFCRRARWEAREEVDRVLVIGIDGATFDVIDPMVARGELPNIGGVIARGARGQLESSIPPVTAAAWVSFMTGVNPGKHGIFNFFELSPDAIRQGQRRLITSRLIASATIWEIVDRAGGRMVAVNVPVTYPPWPIRGAMIPGLPTPAKDETLTHPPELLSEIESATGEYLLEENPSQGDAVPLREWTERYVRIEEQRHRAALHLIGRKEWDLFVIVYGITDRVQHLCWEEYRYGGAMADAVPRAYRTVDRMAGELIARAGPETRLILVSDHGFGDLEKVFCTNRWLREHGFLRLKGAGPGGTQRRPGLRRGTLGGALSRCGFRRVAEFLPQPVRRVGLPVPALRARGPATVDWERTDAFAGNFGIYINVREGDLGTVERGPACEELRRRIMEELEELRDPETGGRVVDLVASREEVYEGRHAERAPDILFRLKGMAYQQQNRPDAKELFADQRGGTHRMQGVLVAAGSPIQPGARFRDAALIDVAPTLLYLLGVPVPREMDGRVLTEGLRQEVLEARPVEVSAAPVERIDLQKRGYRRDEEEAILRQLAGLGYLD